MENKRTVGQYILERKIGEGGMAEVWEATQMPMESQWAIKFLLPKLSGDPELEQRFLNEAKRQGALRHPNIVAATHFFQEDGHSYLVMDYVDGMNLEDRLKRGAGPLSLNDVVQISEDVLDALGYAHSMGYVHRDVKPSNILIDFQRGRVYLSDFGIALAMNEDNRVTKTGTAVGTPDYMSPEQITASSPVDIRSDIYSFGCVLYAMLTGVPPFSHASTSDFGVKQGHVYQQAPPIGQRNPKVTPQIESVVAKCMAKLPAERYQSCGEVMKALREAMTPAPPLQLQPQVQPQLQPQPQLLPQALPLVVTPARKPVKSLLVGVIVVCLLAALGLIGYMYFTAATAPPPVVLRFEGSTTIGDELAASLVNAWLKSIGAKDVKETRGVNANKERTFQIQAILPGRTKPDAISIVANGSGSAFKALKAGTADIGMSSRQVNAAEIGLLDSFNMRLPTTEIVVGMDGIAIVVNQSNSVSTLTRQQVAQIFQGKVRNWSELGGPEQPIAMYGRNKESGTWSTFVDDVLGGKKETYAASIVQKANGEEIAATVAKEPGAIGYVSIAQVNGVKALALSDGPGTQALAPSPFTVATDDYILARRLYLYIPKQSELATEFATFAQSPDGQAVVKQIGFVQQVGDFESVAVPSTAPAEYRDITAGRKRMTLDFRFETNSDHLDNKALADITRAVRGLAKSGAKDIYLLGFADSDGTYKKNLELSVRRATVVAEHLAVEGVTAQVAGFSSDMPLAVDKTPDGKPIAAQQRKNRRVELWARM